jgi:hypothetical protein
MKLVLYKLRDWQTVKKDTAKPKPRGTKRKWLLGRDRERETRREAREWLDCYGPEGRGKVIMPVISTI